MYVEVEEDVLEVDQEEEAEASEVRRKMYVEEDVLEVDEEVEASEVTEINFDKKNLI